MQEILSAVAAALPLFLLVMLLSAVLTAIVKALTGGLLLTGQLDLDLLLGLTAKKCLQAGHVLFQKALGTGAFGVKDHVQRTLVAPAHLYPDAAQLGGL